MLDFNPELVPVSDLVQVRSKDDSALRRNQRAVAATVDDDHYTAEFYPQAFNLNGATRAIAAAVWPVISFADGATQLAHVSQRRRYGWVNGPAEIRLVYSSPVGSTANFSIGVELWGVTAAGAGAVYPGIQLAASTLAAPGPVVADTRLTSAVVYTGPAVPITQQYTELALVVYRVGAAGADTNVNALHLYYATVRYVPKRGD